LSGNFKSESGSCSLIKHLLVFDLLCCLVSLLTEHEFRQSALKRRGAAPGEEEEEPVGQLTQLQPQLHARRWPSVVQLCPEL